MSKNLKVNFKSGILPRQRDDGAQGGGGGGGHPASVSRLGFRLRVWSLGFRVGGVGFRL